jgi:two-component system sensor kinase FixL
MSSSQVAPLGSALPISRLFLGAGALACIAAVLAGVLGWKASGLALGIPGGLSILLLTGLFWSCSRIPKRHFVGILLLFMVAVLIVVTRDIWAYLALQPDVSGAWIGLVPGVSLILLAAAGILFQRTEDWIDQALLSLCSIVLCLSVLSAAVSVIPMHLIPGHSVLAVSLPAALVCATLAAACFALRRELCTRSMLWSELPVWRAARVAIPASLVIPLDRFLLASFRPRIGDDLYIPLDTAVTIFNILVIALVFNWVVWCMISESRAARRNEARLALAIEAPGAGVFDWNMLSGALMWTPEAERRMGLAVGTIRHIDDWAQRVLPEDLEAIWALRDQLASRKKEHFAFRFRMRTANGAWRTFEGTARCFYDELGTWVRTVGINLDVTEREERDAALEENEAQLRSIFENVPDAMVVIAEDGAIRNFSHAAERMFGYRERDVLGENIRKLIHVGGDLQSYLRFGEARPLALPERPIALTACHADGHSFPAELTLGQAQTRRGPVRIAFIRDITDRVEAERHLDDLRNEFAHGMRLNVMGELAAGLAHEINQPLAAGANFLGAADLLVQRDGGNPKLSELLEASRDQLMRAGEIIRRLRDFIANGATEMQVEDVEQTIRDAVAIGLIGLQRNRIEVEYTIGEGAEAMFADRVQIQQILVNLLRNAAQAMLETPSDRRGIRVEAEVVDADKLRIAVIDHGPGFSEDILARLYTPFLTSKGQQGLGIGLSICKRIVEAHGGEMVAKNLPRGGASVSFTLRRPPRSAEGVDLAA